MIIKYPHKSIPSKAILAKKLAITEEYLNQVLINPGSFYRANKPELKADGTYRQHYRVDEKLKIILTKIVKKIFHHVRFPSYIQGSIKDRDHPRDYISNAKLHAGKRLIIKEDIKNFFPSIKASEVEKIWRRLFGFPKEVAEALTKLTTLNGFVPQGAPTSSYLANLIFWDVEPLVVNELSKIGVTYSRYVDDITLSTDSYLSSEEKTTIIKNIYGMCLKKGIKPNRKKHAITTNRQQMTIHGLNVNSKVPTLPKKETAKIRAAVHECKITYEKNGDSYEYKELFNRTIGRVQRLKKLQPSQAKPMLLDMGVLQPKIKVPCRNQADKVFASNIEVTKSLEPPW